jgi:hypothetical protein
LPKFTGCTIEEAPNQWGYGPIEKEKRRLCDLIDAIALLQSGGFCGVSVIGAYHARGVAPLMVRTLALYGMTPYVPLEGTVLTWGPHRNSEIEQRIMEATNMLNDTFEFPILGHPTMHSDRVFIDLVSLFLVSFPGRPFISIQF